MKLQNPAKLLASITVFSIITLMTSPTPTEAILGVDVGQLLGAAALGLALKGAFTVGAALGSASRRRGSYGGGHSRSRGYSRRRSYHYHGKRDAETFFDEVQDLDDIETNLISDGFNLMRKSDPSDCFRRLICDVSTGKEKFSTLTPLLNFVSDKEDQYIPLKLKQFSYQLKMARNLGEGGKNSNVCEETFKCPFTGEDMLEMIMERFEAQKPGLIPS